LRCTHKAAYFIFPAAQLPSCLSPAATASSPSQYTAAWCNGRCPLSAEQYLGVGLWRPCRGQMFSRRRRTSQMCSRPVLMLLVLLAPHTSGPSDVPRCGALSLLQKDAALQGGSSRNRCRLNVKLYDLRDCAVTGHSSAIAFSQTQLFGFQKALRFMGPHWVRALTPTSRRDFWSDRLVTRAPVSRSSPYLLPRPQQVDCDHPG
jgi:hypothetical protein